MLRGAVRASWKLGDRGSTVSTAKSRKRFYATAVGLQLSVMGGWRRTAQTRRAHFDSKIREH